MLRLIKRCPNSRIFIRRASSLTFDKEEAEFANRKAIISKNADQYYKPLSDIRYSDVKRLRIPEFREQFTNYKFPEGVNRIDEEYTVEGKIHSIRKSGKGMIFIDLIQDYEKVQLVLMNKLVGVTKDEFSEYHDSFKRGDFIVAKGYPGTTNVGELSLKCTESLKLAAPTLHPLPPKLTNSEKRHLNRIVDYSVNSESQQVIITRSKIIASLRNFLNKRGFLEVSTPIIANSSKGANAKPFITQSQHLKDTKTGTPLDLQLRVAPELWLKKLIIGGFDKVFEIGTVFRNEGIDGTHNCEFTTCEFYQTFTTLEELMELTELFFQNVSKELQNIPSFKETSELILSVPFKKLEFIPTIESTTGVKFPSHITSESLLEYYTKIELSPPPVKSTPQLLDKLSSTYIEPLCTTPTFIYHQPSIMSPLAKSTNITYNESTYSISRRFELFIKGKEFVNAYEEENSPFEQTEKFKLQQSLKNEFNDDESLIPDEKYTRAMEWGMPPTGGWGIGIDRLVMLFTGQERIEEVLTFGTLTDVVRQ